MFTLKVKSSVRNDKNWLKQIKWKVVSYLSKLEKRVERESEKLTVEISQNPGK